VKRRDFLILAPAAFAALALPGSQPIEWSVNGIKQLRHLQLMQSNDLPEIDDVLIDFDHLEESLIESMMVQCINGDTVPVEIRGPEGFHATGAFKVISVDASKRPNVRVEFCGRFA